jgi:hypothetical protein
MSSSNGQCVLLLSGVDKLTMYDNNPNKQQKFSESTGLATNLERAEEFK